MKTCQWCDVAFETTVSYQIYCSAECREEATKDKIAQRYAMSRRKRMMGKKRYCNSCGQQLSAYNDDAICTSCIVNPKEVSLTLKLIKKMAEGKDV